MVRKVRASIDIASTALRKEVAIHPQAIQNE
jgi:hypothetical protein